MLFGMYMGRNVFARRVGVAVGKFYGIKFSKRAVNY